MARLTWLAVLSCTVAAGAEMSPVGWRHDSTGRFPDATPPQTWSAEENVVWKVKLPGSNSCPLVLGDRVFVGAEPTKLVCLGAADGHTLWEAEHGYDQVLGEAELAAAERDMAQADAIRKEEIEPLQKELSDVERELQNDPEDEALKARAEELREKHGEIELRLKPLEEYRVPQRSAGNTTATPASDGRHVYFACGTGLVACYDLEGNRRWVRMVDRPSLDWGHTASPLVVGDLVLVHMQDLVALDAASGSERWRQELEPRYGSPARCRIGEDEAVVTSAGDLVLVADGRVAAKKIAEPLGQCSPVVHEGVAYFIQTTAQAVRLPEAIGDEPQKLWETKLFEDNYYASPLVHEGLVYAVSEQRVMSVLDAADGEVQYEQRLRFKARGPVVSSLAEAGGLIAVFQDSGQAKLLRPGREYAEAAENPLEGLRSSPTFAGERLYVRTHEHVYCLGE